MACRASRFHNGVGLAPSPATPTDAERACAFGIRLHSSSFARRTPKGSAAFFSAREVDGRSGPGNTTRWSLRPRPVPRRRASATRGTGRQRRKFQPPQVRRRSAAHNAPASDARETRQSRAASRESASGLMTGCEAESGARRVRRPGRTCPRVASRAGDRARAVPLPAPSPRGSRR